MAMYRPVPPAQPNRSLVHAMECLYLLAGAGRPVGSREAARLLGIEHTRASRLLGTLAWLGLAEKTPEKKYTPGPGIHVLAALGLRSSRLLAAAVPPLKELRKVLPRLNLALGVLWNAHVCYLLFSSPGTPVEEGIASRDPYPAEKSSIGIVLLARLPEEEVERLYRTRPGGGLPAGELRALHAARRRAASRGYAVVDGRTIGVPVGDPPVAGLAASGTLAKKDIPALARLLSGCAADIARNLDAERRTM